MFFTRIFLLDAGGAGLALAILAIFMVVAVVSEAVVMLLMKYNDAGKAFLDSFVANISSLVIGFLIVYVSNSRLFDLTDSVFLNWALIILLTIAIEFVILYFMNRSKTKQRTFAVAVIMNLASYFILYFFVTGT